jgi:hypothetical protein
MSAVEPQVDGKEQVCVPGLGPNYPLKNLVGFLSELKNSVDLMLLVACPDVTSASIALITKRGGRSAVGKALQSSQVKLILSPKQRAKPAASRTRTCTNAAVCIASGECPSRF